MRITAHLAENDCIPRPCFFKISALDTIVTNGLPVGDTGKPLIGILHIRFCYERGAMDDIIRLIQSGFFSRFWNLESSPLSFISKTSYAHFD